MAAPPPALEHSKGVSHTLEWMGASGSAQRYERTAAGRSLSGACAACGARARDAVLGPLPPSPCLELAELPARGRGPAAFCEACVHSDRLTRSLRYDTDGGYIMRVASSEGWFFRVCAPTPAAASAGVRSRALA